MDISKIRMKIGEHEFEAEGPADSVQSQFEAFRNLISEASLKTVDKTLPQEQEPPLNQQVVGIQNHVPLEKILRVSGRVVSLTAIPAAVEDAALLILLGNRELRDNESATGQEIGDGLEQSGRPVPRVDRVVGKLIEDAYVLKTGLKRSSRYRLSNSGHQKALAVARELIATLP